MVDFRPFKVGTNIRERKAIEEEARSNVQVIGWLLENEKTGEKVTFMEPEAGKITYYKTYAKNDGWRVVEQIKTEPYVERDGKRVPISETKISDLAIEDREAGDITDEILEDKGYTLMIIAYKLKGKIATETVSAQDTAWATDTVRVGKDSIRLTRRIVEVKTRSVNQETFVPEPDYERYFLEKINPLAKEAMQANWRVFAVSATPDYDKAPAFAKRIQAAYPFHTADDKLLKTIIRANPGVVVLKDGKVLKMYHHRHLPKFADLPR